MSNLTIAEIAKTLDLAVLRPTATLDNVKAACEAAIKYQTASVCIRPDYVEDAVRILKGTKIPVGTVVGFPLGYGPYELKEYETLCSVNEGAREIDMVINLGYFLQGRYDLVGNEIKLVKRICHKRNSILKVILETCYLTPTQIAFASRIAADSGADFVKTSTGFGEGGATPEAVQIILDAVGPNVGVKASGGIKTREDVVRYLRLGCRRLGVSSYKDILGV